MQPTVLFIDDEPRILRAMQRLLRPYCNVLIADNGLDALEIISVETVHVIVCDQRMPNMNGVEVLTEARKLSPRTIRILLTGYSDMDDAVAALNDGHIYRYLNKPWTNEVLIETVMDATKLAKSIKPKVAAKQVADEITAVKESKPTFLSNSDAVGTGVMVVNLNDELVRHLEPLARAKVPVHRASDAAEARNMVLQRRIGAVVAGSDDSELIYQLRQDHPQIVVVAIAEEADINDLRDLINSGDIYRFLTKPVTADQLNASVRSALARHSHQHAASA
ncbi:MAG: response regulator [Wenzhouxiangellaceae bacterium]